MALEQAGSVIITRNGQSCAVLMPVTEDTDLDIVARSQNRRFWKLFEANRARGQEEGWAPLEEL